MKTDTSAFRTPPAQERRFSANASGEQRFAFIGEGSSSLSPDDDDDDDDDEKLVRETNTEKKRRTSRGNAETVVRSKRTHRNQASSDHA